MNSENDERSAGPVDEAPPERQQHDTPPRPRSWPIAWGVIVLVVCVYSAMQIFSPGPLDATTWIIATTIGLGALLLAVGIAVLLRGRR